LDHSAGGVYQPETYAKFSTPSEQYVIDIALDLKNMAESNGYTTSLEIAEFIYAFVGDIQYVLDIDGSGESDYPKYPIEMLWEASGDCEDAAILYISLIESVNYDAMIVTGFVKPSSDEDWGGHAWAVVSIPGEDNLGTYWYGDGAKSQTKFYFVETTAYYDGVSHIGENPWYDIDDESYYDVE
jgi:transglutaminase-like putative cysteine protease